MAACTDKIVKQLEPKSFETLKNWRKAFCAPLTKDEISRVKTLSVAVEALWQQQVTELARVRKATSDELHVWPNPQPNRAPTTTAQKDAIYQREMLSEKVRNASPYRRLKLVMDYWCALWFWPVDQASLLPTREEWWFVLETVLLGNANPVSFAAPQDDLFPETLPQLELDFSPERDRHGHVNLDVLMETLPQLQIVQTVTDGQRFFHWELEFADIFSSNSTPNRHSGMDCRNPDCRDASDPRHPWSLGSGAPCRNDGNFTSGFDLILGNPPWIKVEWNEQALLSDFDPRFALRKLSAKQAADQREQVLADYPQAQADYIKECIATEGMAAFLNATQNYPLLKGVQSNLYKCFLPVVWRLGGKAPLPTGERGWGEGHNIGGVQALLHPEGPYDDPKGGALRAASFRRLRAHYQFQNELSLFPEVDHHMKFSINLYGPELASPRFRHVANLFAPATVNASLNHPGGGLTPGIKRDEGGWNTSGHQNRVIEVDADTLAVFAKLYDEPGIPAEQARLPAVHSRELVSVLEKFAAVEQRLGDLQGDYFTLEMWHETNAQKDGTIRRSTGFVATPAEFVLSGPHFYVGNPLNKTPRAVCALNSHYDGLDLEHIPDDYLPRSNYVPACAAATYAARVPRVSWSEPSDIGPMLPKSVTKYYRHINREMISPSAERSLIPALIPIGYTHIQHF